MKRWVRLGATSDVVINLQGDLPTIDPGDIRKLTATLVSAPPSADIATLVTQIRGEDEDDE